MSCSRRLLYIAFVLLLVWGNIYFSYPIFAQTTEDDAWMKERLARIHVRYTWAGDHDQFLYKLQQASQNTQDDSVREALDQIIIWWEELRPPITRAWVSSIPSTFATQEVVLRKTDTTKKAIVKEAIAKEDQIKDEIVPSSPQEEKLNAEQYVPKSKPSDARYQLSNGYIDVAVLQSTRLGRVNELRESRGRHALVLHPLLHKTAADRSETMRHKWIADHKRFAWSAYYSYGELEARFADRGVEFVNVSRATFTENIGRSTFRCSQEDCTQTAIDAMRTTFNFYLREEGTKNDAHRRTMIHPLFQIVWLWIAVDESIGKFYLTTHYWTEI